jgi:hypothetical protein
MTGRLQPLDQKFQIVEANGTPTAYFIRWAQQRQIDIGEAITAADALAIVEEYLADHELQEGSGIAISPSGNISDSPTISAEVQAILDQISTTWGAVLFRGTADWQALAPGTSGHFLQTSGAGADPVWAAAGGGGSGAEVLISEQSPVATNTVSFTSIPATYRDLRVVVRGRGTVAAISTSVLMQFNGDTGTNYERDRMGTTNGSSVNASASASNFAETSIPLGTFPGSTASTSITASADCRIFDYRGTTFFKHAQSIVSGRAGTTQATWGVNIFGGNWESTAAINRVDVFTSTGNFETGSVVSLYGIT